MNELIKIIKILPSNKHYRLGDLILRKGLRWEYDRTIILNEKKYEDSFLRKYLENLSNPENECFNIEVFKKVIKEYKDKYSYDKNALYINIRSGDVVMPEENELISIDYYRQNIKLFIFNQEILIKKINHNCPN